MNRISRHKRIRRKVVGTPTRPRVSIFRSNKHIQAQLIDDQNKKTIIGLSSVTVEGKSLTKTAKAKELGLKFAEEVLKNTDIKDVIFDRGGYKYHGRVKVFAEALREKGLNF